MTTYVCLHYVNFKYGYNFLLLFGIPTRSKKIQYNYLKGINLPWFVIPEIHNTVRNLWFSLLPKRKKSNLCDWGSVLKRFPLKRSISLEHVLYIQEYLSRDQEHDPSIRHGCVWRIQKIWNNQDNMFCLYENIFDSERIHVQVLPWCLHEILCNDPDLHKQKSQDIFGTESFKTFSRYLIISRMSSLTINV